MKENLPCEPCPIEMKSRCIQCLTTMKSIFPKIPSLLAKTPLSMSAHECAAINDLWCRAGGAEKIEAEWMLVKSELRELWSGVMTSWLFSDVEFMISSCDSEKEIKDLVLEISNEAKRIRKMFGFCAEIARLSRLRIRTSQIKEIELTQLIKNMIVSDMDVRLANIEILNALPKIESDENRWTMIILELLRGSFEIGAKIKISSDDDDIFFEAGEDGVPSEKMTTISPRGINIYRAKRMMSWERCEMSIEEDDHGVLVTVKLSPWILGREWDPDISTPISCMGCVERMRSLYDIYSSMVVNEEEMKLPSYCRAAPILKGAARLKRIMFNEWDNSSNNIERAARDACEPVNSIIRISSRILSDTEPNDDMLMDLMEKIETSRSFMVVLNELNKIVFVENDLFSEGSLFENIPLISILNDAIDENKELIFQKDADVIILSDLPSAFIRKKRWVIAFSEMIKNSLIYNETIKPRIEVWADGSKIFLKDNGIGMSREKWLVVFDIFTSLKTGSHSILGDENSKGVGLFMTKRYIRWDEGDVRILDSDSSGTTMEISLPHPMDTT